MGPAHTYDVTMTWTGNDGVGTADYRSYRRDNVVACEGLPDIEGSSDRTFHGDPSRWNPEQLLVAALSQCHLLTFLHLCAINDVVVTAYVDRAHGEMRLNKDDSGEFTSVTLRPTVTVADETMVERAAALHEEAHHLCFIARSVNFPVGHEATTVVA